MIRVSVVVPTYQRPARLPGLVAALEAQTLPVGEFEVIVADDGSGDETSAVLEDLRSSSRIDLQVLTAARNAGPGAARNRGWRAARGPIVAFTDDDCMPSPGWLEAGLARMEGSSVDIVQGRTIPDPTVDSLNGRSQRLETFTQRYETCNIFYRTDVLRAAGGFDETIYFFGEDTDLGLRARAQGASMDFIAEALVYHEVTYPTVGTKWRYAVQHGNWALLVRRHPELRKEMLTYRLFTKRVHAGFISAVIGAAVAPFWLPALALAIPYVVHRRPRALSREALTRPLWDTFFDAMNVSGLVLGSLRERTLVL